MTPLTVVDLKNNYMFWFKEYVSFKTYASRKEYKKY